MRLFTYCMSLFLTGYEFLESQLCYFSNPRDLKMPLDSPVTLIGLVPILSNCYLQFWIQSHPWQYNPYMLFDFYDVIQYDMNSKSSVDFIMRFTESGYSWMVNGQKGTLNLVSFSQKTTYFSKFGRDLKSPGTCGSRKDI